MAKRICLLLLLNVATYVLSSVTWASSHSPPLSSSSPSASSFARARAEHDDISVHEVGRDGGGGGGGGGGGRAFYYYNGTAMVNTTTVAITLAFYSVIALGIYSLVAGAAAEQMAEIVEVSQVDEVFKVAADAVFGGIDLDLERGGGQGEHTGRERAQWIPQSQTATPRAGQGKKYETEYEDYFEDHEAWASEDRNQDAVEKKRADMFGRG